MMETDKQKLIRLYNRIHEIDCKLTLPLVFREFKRVFPHELTKTEYSNLLGTYNLLNPPESTLDTLLGACIVKLIHGELSYTSRRKNK